MSANYKHSYEIAISGEKRILASETGFFGTKREIA